MLGDLIKEAAEEYNNAPIGKGIVSNSKWYNLFVNVGVRWKQLQIVGKKQPDNRQQKKNKKGQT